MLKRSRKGLSFLSFRWFTYEVHRTDPPVVTHPRCGLSPDLRSSQNLAQSGNGQVSSPYLPGLEGPLAIVSETRHARDRCTPCRTDCVAGTPARHHPEPTPRLKTRSYEVGHNGDARPADDATKITGRHSFREAGPQSTSRRDDPALVLILILFSTDVRNNVACGAISVALVSNHQPRRQVQFRTFRSHNEDQGYDGVGRLRLAISTAKCSRHSSFCRSKTRPGPFPSSFFRLQRPVNTWPSSLRRDTIRPKFTVREARQMRRLVTAHA